MKYPIVAEFLSRTIGLEPSSLGESGLVHAVDALMKIMGCDNERDFIEKIQNDTEAFDRLITATTVPETWFFREPQAFAAMEELAKSFHLKKPSATFRILSMACCSGEEPYSAAMTLIAAGIPKENFCIDAFDINALSIELAMRGIYHKKSFRTSTKAYAGLTERYFTPGNEDGQLVLDPEIITQVNFSQGNLTDPATLPSRKKYDVIFCRNVLIYLTPQARQSVLDCIRNMLFDGGTLFVGPSEIITSDYFRPLERPQSFGYTYTAMPPAKPQETPQKQQDAEKPSPRRTQVRSEETRSQLRKAHHWNLPPRQDELPKDPIEKARALADMGKLGEAADICNDFIERNASDPSPSAFYLMGVINEAQGNHDDAWGFFQKALYLQADHLESLQYLWLLARQKGDAATAGNMQRRMQRIMERRKEHSVK